MALVYGTDYYETKAFNVGADKKGMTATRYVRVPDPTKIFQFILEFFPVAAGGDPEAAATFPNTPFLVVTNLKIVPVAGDEDNFAAVLSLNPKNGFDVQITYSTLAYDQEGQGSNADLPQSPLDRGNPDAWFSWHISIGGQYITHDGLALVWPDGTAVGPNVNGGLIEPTLEHKLTFQHVPIPPWAAIRRCRGKTNAEWILGSPPGCLLFLGCEADREQQNTGIRSWTVSLSFSEKNNGGTTDPYSGVTVDPYNPGIPYGWNFQLRPPYAGNTRVSWQMVGIPSLRTRGQAVGAIVLDDPGLGYATAPQVTISGGGGSGAAATCFIDTNGEIIAVIVTNGGSGYTSTPTIGFEVSPFDPDPSNAATAHALLTATTIDPGYPLVPMSGLFLPGP